MPEQGEGIERINVFRTSGSLVFKHYFEEYELFAELQDYYSGNRFEVPIASFGGIRETLNEYSYDPVIVEDIEQYCVAVRRYTEHPDTLFKNSVIKKETTDYNIFIMKDLASKERAIQEGAVPLNELGLKITL